MERIRQAHIDNAIDYLNGETGRRYFATSEEGRKVFEVLPDGTLHRVLTARTKRELLALIEAYTQGVIDYA